MKFFIKFLVKLFSTRDNFNARNERIETTKARILKIGMRGDDVADVQLALRLKDDGNFGPVTERAVKRFQIVAGLDADGIVGPITRAKLLGK